MTHLQIVDRRPVATGPGHETIFLFSKRGRYYVNHDALTEPAAGASRGKAATLAPRRGQGETPGKPPQKRPGRDERYSGPFRHMRDVWTIPVSKGAAGHYATYPESLVDRIISIATRPGDLVLDPFSGSGTTGVVAIRRHRRFVGVELNPQYAAFASLRMAVV